MLAEKSSLKMSSHDLRNNNQQVDCQDGPLSSRLKNKCPDSRSTSRKSVRRLYPRLSASSIVKIPHSHLPNGVIPASKKKKSLTFNTKYLIETGGRRGQYFEEKFEEN